MWRFSDRIYNFKKLINFALLSLLIASASVISPALQGKTIAQAADTCNPIFTTYVKLSNGQSITGTASAVIETRTDEESPTQLDFRVEISSNGVLVLCQPSEAEFNDWKLYQSVIDASSTHFQFSRGDQIYISFANASSKGVKNQFYKHVLTSKDVSNNIAGIVIKGPDLIVANNAQLNSEVKIGATVVDDGSFTIDIGWNESDPTYNAVWEGYKGSLASNGTLSVSGLLDGNYAIVVRPNSVINSAIGTPTYQKFSVRAGVISWEDNSFSFGEFQITPGNFKLHMVLNTNGEFRNLSPDESKLLRGVLVNNCGNGTSEDQLVVLRDGTIAGVLPESPCNYTLTINNDNPLSGIAPFSFDFNFNGTDIDSADLVNGKLHLHLADITFRATNVTDVVDAGDNFYIYSKAGNCSSSFEESGPDACEEVGSQLSLTKGDGIMPSLENGEYWFFRKPSSEFGELAANTLLAFSISTLNGKKIISAVESDLNAGNLIVNELGNYAKFIAPVGNVVIRETDHLGRPVGFVGISSDIPYSSDNVTSGRGSFDGLSTLQSNVDGTYSVVLTPQFNLLDVAPVSISVTIDTVDGKHVVTSMASNGQLLNANVNGEYELVAPQPNFAGYVLTPDLNTKVYGAAVKWTCNFWTESNLSASGSIITTAKGEFGVALDAGVCRIEIEPGWSQPNFGVNKFHILIQDNHSICLIDRSTFMSANNGDVCASYPLLPSGEAELFLSDPNLQGTIRIDDGAPTSGDPLPKGTWLFSTLTNLKGTSQESSVSISDSGEFVYSLLDNGNNVENYKLVVHTDTLAGYSTLITYIHGSRNDSDEMEYCLADTPPSGSTDLACSTGFSPSVALNLDLEVKRASLQIVTSFDPAPTASVWPWGSITPYGSNGNVDWRDTTYLQSSFRTLSATVGTPGQSPKKYQLVLHASSSDPYTDISKDIWIGDFINETDALEICFAATLVSNQCPEGSLYNSGANISQVFTTGNIRGNVFGPSNTASSSTRIGWSYVEVQEKVGSNWIYTTKSKMSNERGRFGLNLENGFYRLVANPQYGSKQSFAPARRYVLVADGLACEADETESCLTTANASASLDIHLSQPNISGTLSHSDSSKNVQNSTATLFSGTGVSRSFVKNVSIGSKGNFGFYVESPGAYQIEFTPAWSIRGTAAKTTITFNVECVDGVCQVADSDQSTVSTVTLESPTLQIQVCKQSSDASWASACVPASMASIHVTGTGSTDFWAQTDSEGNFGDSLGNGTYAIQLEPSSSTDGAQIATSLVVSGPSCTFTSPTDSNSVTGSDCQSLKAKFSSPNIVGSINYQLNSNSIPIVMPNSSYRIYDNSTSVLGTASTSGEISSYISSTGTKRFWMDVYANTAIASRQKLQLTLEFTNGALTNWAYGKQSDLTAAIPDVRKQCAGSCVFEPNFDAVQSNLTIVLEGTDKPHLVTIFSGSNQISVMSSGGSGVNNIAKFYLDSNDYSAFTASMVKYVDENSCLVTNANYTSSDYSSSSWTSKNVTLTCP